MAVEFRCSEVDLWKEALSSYSSKLRSLSDATSKPDLITMDEFYRHELPGILRCRNPSPHLTRSELVQIMRWKLARGKWRPRLMDFVSNLDEELVKSSSSKAFQSLPDVSQAVSELTVLKGVGPATASAVLAAYAPHVAPFMSDEAMEAALGHSKDYSLKQYLLFVEKLQKKAKVTNFTYIWLRSWTYFCMLTAKVTQKESFISARTGYKKHLIGVLRLMKLSGYTYPGPGLPSCILLRHYFP